MPATVQPGTRESIERKLGYLRELINRDTTPENEILAAKSKYERLRKRLDDAPAARKWKPAWQGSLYEQTKNLTLTQVTALIRTEIKLAKKLAAAAVKPGELALPDPFAVIPAGIKFGVRQPHFGKIIITVKNIPAEWGFTTREGSGPDEFPTHALYDLGSALTEIGNAYSYDNSDIMTDYHDKRYFLDVQAEGRNGRCGQSIKNGIRSCRCGECRRG